MVSEWWRHLRGRPFYWVLDGTLPAADLFVLRHVLERPAGARAHRAARLALDESNAVRTLKAGLNQPGEGLWHPRYRAPLWRLRFLAEIGASADERIAEALDCLLDRPADEAGAPPVNLDALLLHAGYAFGFADEPRLAIRAARLRARLERAALPDDQTAHADWLVQALLALAECPPSRRDPELLRLLLDRLRRLEPTSLPRYARATFPLFDQPDDLALAGGLLRLGQRPDWLAPWIAQIEARQDEDGRWSLDHALERPDGVAWEREGSASRWITARAMYVLRAYYGESGS